jgi:hypothetical protein
MDRAGEGLRRDDREGLEPSSKHVIGREIEQGSLNAVSQPQRRRYATSPKYLGNGRRLHVTLRDPD